MRTEGNREIYERSHRNPRKPALPGLRSARPFRELLRAHCARQPPAQRVLPRACGITMPLPWLTGAPIAVAATPNARRPTRERGTNVAHVSNVGGAAGPSGSPTSCLTAMPPRPVLFLIAPETQPAPPERPPSGWRHNAYELHRRARVPHWLVGCHLCT
ncbi:hypothetical protein PsYK624_001600 [Phanerochaete sordida]|uniref:Uncharacterized protein n=1 Tax=Phanerochaete sordida TaxID=48140 RepID=A0A9P3L6P7_9APHY|nr:hypothetical protein PsYK624_001600 [Phanerochaete sordida]